MSVGNVVADFVVIVVVDVVAVVVADVVVVVVVAADDYPVCLR